MSAPKAKSAPANGKVAKGKAAKAPVSDEAPVSTTAKTQDAKPEAEPVPAATGGSGRPDKAAYDAEQEKIRKEIDALQVKVNAVKEKIALATKSGSGNDRRSVLRSQLDEIRGQQSNNKASRGKIIDQLKTIQDGIQKKIKDLNAAKAKTPFKSVAEVDAHIKNLEKQVESGNMKLADEKRALQEISQMKRSRRTVENFQADQDSIEADRRAADELRKQLDDPELKAVSERYDSIKAELDEIKKESDEAYAGRSKLFEERDDLQAQLTVLFNQKRASTQQYRDANDRYWNKVNEDRARRAERARTERAAQELQKKQEVAERLREEAAAPAFQAQIEDCQTLVDYFQGKNSGNVNYKSAPSALPAKAEVSGVPKLELRKVEATEDGLVARKKKGEDVDAYFVGGGKSKGKGKKGASKVPTEKSNGPASADSHLNVPLPTLSALLSLSIPPPTSTADISRVVSDLQKKQSWFQANQARVTAENIAKAEAEVKRLTKSDGKGDAPGGPSDVVPPNGAGEQPPEPAPTPQVADHTADAVPFSAVQEKLEEVKEEAVEA